MIQFEPKVRCYGYARKSSDEGLTTQQFNSLNAQHASIAAYVASQAGRGWGLMPEMLEDGGFSGGNTQRPGLIRLIELVRMGKVDVVLVYKLDRLSRNIRDFAMLIELFETHGVSLVSVTQSFDTSTAMGKLMLNILVSFASFERELASERTRDKIALQRQRGQWTGGRPMLGYEITPTGLVINPIEAAVVRDIFRWYLDLRSLTKVLERLAATGITNKRWTTKAGKPQGGIPFGKNTLSQLLSSILYRGQVPHKDKVYKGQHAAIIDESVFQRVQELLAENRRCGPSAIRNRHHGLLKGLVVCACCGKPMVHTFTSKDHVTRRYYSCNSRIGATAKKCAGGTVPAGQLEEFVLDKVRHRFAEPAMVTRVLDLVRAQSNDRQRDLEAQRTLVVAEIEAAQAILNAGPNADASERHQQATSTLADVERQLRDIEATLVDRATVARGLTEFTAIWVSLSPSERASLLATVVGEVRWDATKGEIAITERDDNAVTLEATP
jgi:site-specific DNA recombinase